MTVRLESQAEPIPGYKLLERLGGGGFGEVWKALAPGGLYKAIKFVYGDLEAASTEMQRAEQELKALSRVKSVRHPYILSLERYDIIDGQLIIVMELADRSLWDRFRDCQEQGLPGVPREELLGYMRETAEALDLMNVQYQLQHLDIKPQNLFLVHNHIKVADFGLVKDLEGRMASVTGGVTPVYAAPETFDGWVSRYSDQYSLAIVYQELLTGQRPFAGSNIRQLIFQHLQASPNLSPLPACDRDTIGRALAKNPDDRFPNCQEFVQALRGSLPGKVVEIEKRGQDNRPQARAAQSTGVEETLGNLRSVVGPATDSPIKEQDSDHTETFAAPKNGSSGWIRVAEKAERKLHETPSTPLIPDEITGDGILFPALVLGVGGLGIEVLRRLHANLALRFGPADALPNIRLLGIDTDPESQHEAAQGGPIPGLPAGEMMLVKLNRPSHYLRSQEDRERIDSWFNLKMLYRLPRTPVTTGLRALGRLAFLDHYQAINRRLRSELLECTRPDRLSAVSLQTGLGLRSNRPRVYVIAGLGGGTGGGMFLDLAYTLRTVLKQFGCSQPEIVGVFLLPAVDRDPSRTLALGNAFAALTELNHYSSSGTIFTARYDDKAEPFSDDEPPYSRCIMLQLPQRPGDGPIQELLDGCADFLGRELTTTLASTTQKYRSECPVSGRHSIGLTCQSFGMFRISWPRTRLLQKASRKLCQHLIQHWINKDATSIRDQIRTALTEFWTHQGLGGENLLARLQASSTEALGQSPETLFAGIIEPIGKLDAVASKPSVAATISSVLDQLDKIIGRAQGCMGSAGSLAELLKTAAEALTAEGADKLAKFAVHLIEEPEFRLAGAEEAIRQAVLAIEEALRRYEPSCKELTARATDAGSRLPALVAAIQEGTAGDRRRQALIKNLVELLQVYPNWRYQSMLLQRIISSYVCLRGQLSDQLREINFCRDRLVELLRAFQTVTQPGTTAEEGLDDRNVFPPGCRNLNETVEQLLSGVSAAERQELDVKMQKLIQRQFTALVHVCMTSTNLLRDVEAAMQQEAEAFVDTRLGGMEVAELYLAGHAGDEETLEDLCAIFKEARPAALEMNHSAEQGLNVLAVPPHPSGERLYELAKQALPDISWIRVDSKDDIVIYREIPRLPLPELAQLGPLAYEAYCHMSQVEYFTPHSRADITEWKAAHAG